MVERSGSSRLVRGIETASDTAEVCLNDSSPFRKQVLMSLKGLVKDYELMRKSTLSVEM